MLLWPRRDTEDFGAQGRYTGCKCNSTVPLRKLGGGGVGGSSSAGESGGEGAAAASISPTASNSRLSKSSKPEPASSAPFADASAKSAAVEYAASCPSLKRLSRGLSFFAASSFLASLDRNPPSGLRMLLPASLTTRPHAPRRSLRSSILRFFRRTMAARTAGTPTKPEAYTRSGRYVLRSRATSGPAEPSAVAGTPASRESMPPRYSTAPRFAAPRRPAETS